MSCGSIEKRYDYISDVKKAINPHIPRLSMHNKY
mgnify:CR=1 FL=1